MGSSPAAPPHGEGGATMSAAAAAAVCCMCGDQGLPDELFRCRCCRARLQHRYCSDLYLRAAAYRRCNWCLREPGVAHQGRRPAAAAAVPLPAYDSSSKPEEERKTTAPASDEERRQRPEGCSPRRSISRSPSAGLVGHLPVKKKHRADAEEKTPPPAAAASAGKKKEIVATAAAAAAAGSGKDKEVMRAGKPRVNRVRVRRYKLLAEVISC